MRHHTGHRARLISLGIVILLLGLATAGLIHWRAQHHSAQPTSPPPGEWQDTSLSREDSKKSARDIEMYYGKIGLLVVRLQDWFSEPESWVLIIATVSTLAAAACFLAANRLR